MSVSVYIDSQPAIASGLAKGVDLPKVARPRFRVSRFASIHLPAERRATRLNGFTVP